TRSWPMLPDDRSSDSEFPPTMLPGSTAEQPPAPVCSPPTGSTDADPQDATCVRPASDSAPPVAPPSFPGQAKVPGYEVMDVLGRGGMGVVYKARHLKLNRIVALKMILHSGHAGADEYFRFLHEAEAIAAIKHPGVVQVYDFGTHDGAPYFALEYCEA